MDPHDAPATQQRSGLFGLLGRRWISMILIFLGLILVLAYQNENRQGARELAVARAVLLAQAGTEHVIDRVPQIVPEAENYYAIPEVQRWRKDEHTYVWPGSDLVKLGFRLPVVLDLPGQTRLDLTGWAGSEELAGDPIPSGQEIVTALRERMGDGGTIIDGLIAGLGRQRTQMIPSMRKLLDDAGGDLIRYKIPAMSAVFASFEKLGLHLRAAALTGDRQRVVDLTGVMTRLSEGMGSDPLIIFSLVSSAMDGVTLKALQEGLQCWTLTDADYEMIQDWLRRIDDVERQREVFEMMALGSHNVHTRIAGMVDHGDYSIVNSMMSGGTGTRWPGKLYRWGPRGWLDFNHATSLNFGLVLAGEPGGEGWRSAIRGLHQANRDLADMSTLFKIGDYSIPNPRRLIAAVEMPAFSGIWQSAVQNLFMRRSAVLTCALQRHRLQHGSFPEELDALEKAHLPEPMLDPAWEGSLLNYRRTEKGFVVWSVGQDRKDDGADAGLDWVWVQEG